MSFGFIGAGAGAAAAPAAATTAATLGTTIATGGIGLAASLGALGVQAAVNASQASKAWDRQKNLMTRGPSYTREGLLAAGINPILAAGSIGPGTARPPQAAGTGMPNTAQAMAAVAQLRATQAQTRKTNAEGATIEAGLPRAINLRDFDLTPAGAMDASRSRVNASSPQTLQAGLIRLFNSFKDDGRSKLNELLNPRDRSFPNIVPLPPKPYRAKPDPAPPYWQRPEWE